MRGGGGGGGVRLRGYRGVENWDVARGVKPRAGVAWGWGCLTSVMAVGVQMGVRAADLTALRGSLHPDQLLLSVSNDAVDCSVQLCNSRMVLQVTWCGQPLRDSKAEGSSLAEELERHPDSICNTNSFC